MTSLLIVMAIVIAVVLGFKTNINTGFFAIVFAYLIGCIFLQMKPREIIQAWPVSTMFSILAVTMFYSFAIVNGTLEKLSKYLLYSLRRFSSWMPFVLFFVATMIAALGAGNFAVVAFMAPLTLLLCEEIHMSKLLGAIAINAGSLVGGNFMTSNLGIIFRGLMDEATQDSVYAGFDSFGCCAILFLVTMVFSLILIGLFRFMSKENRAMGSQVTIERPEAFTNKQKVNLILMLVMLGIVLIFPLLHIVMPGNRVISDINGKIDISLVAIIFTVLALFFDLAPQKEAMQKVPWNTIIMVCGVGILIQIAIKAGTIDFLGSWIGSNIPVFLVPVMFGLVGSFMSFFSSTIGVVCPALFPLIPGIADATGLNPVLLFVATLVGSQSSAISPFSASGSMIVGSCSTEEERNALFKGLIFRAVPCSICTALAVDLVLTIIL